MSAQEGSPTPVSKPARKTPPQKNWNQADRAFISAASKGKTVTFTFQKNSNLGEDKSGIIRVVSDYFIEVIWPDGPQWIAKSMISGIRIPE